MNAGAGTTATGCSARYWQMNDNFADLIERPKVEPYLRLMQPCLKGKTVLVTGGGGSIGSEVCRQAIDWGCTKLIILELSEYNLYNISTELNEYLEAQVTRQETPQRSTLKSTTPQSTTPQSTTANNATNAKPLILGRLGSVQNRALLKKLMTEHSIDTVYHAAAYKHVALVETNPVEGMKNNLFGTLNVVEEAINTGVNTVVVVSTDKAVRPTNMMGASKRLAELGSSRLAKIQPLDNPTRVAIVRFGNVAGSSGSVLPRFQQQIQRKQPITITDPGMRRFFMTIQEAAELIIQAGTLSNRGDVFHLDMGESIEIESLARGMIARTEKNLRLPAKTYPLMADKQRQPSDNITIRYIGAHPAEKLEEALLIDGQRHTTLHPKIFRIEECQTDEQEIARLIEDIRAACEKDERQQLSRCLTHKSVGWENQSPTQPFRL